MPVKHLIIPFIMNKIKKKKKKETKELLTRKIGQPPNITFILYNFIIIDDCFSI